MLDMFQLYRSDGVGGGNLGKCQTANVDVQADRLPKPGHPGTTDGEAAGAIAVATRESKMVRRGSAAPAAMSRECSSGGAGVDRDVRSTAALCAKHDLPVRQGE